MYLVSDIFFKKTKQFPYFYTIGKDKQIKTMTKKLKHDVYLVKKLQIRDLALVSGLCHVAQERYWGPLVRF